MTSVEGGGGELPPETACSYFRGAKYNVLFNTFANPVGKPVGLPTENVFWTNPYSSTFGASFADRGSKCRLRKIIGGVTPPPPPHTHVQTCKHRQTGSSHCSSFVYTFSQHLSYVLYTFGKRGHFSNWGPYCSFCYKSPVWMPKQTRTHTPRSLRPWYELYINTKENINLTILVIQSEHEVNNTLIATCFLLAHVW